MMHLQAAPKPEGDKYGFTHFAHKLNSSEGVSPLPSDSRRRKDRHALQVRRPWRLVVHHCGAMSGVTVYTFLYFKMSMPPDCWQDYPDTIVVSRGKGDSKM
jgi:hypothetical protein